MRRLFASSPRDPRYHMLEHLSAKFRSQPQIREPRAALILNRFSRELPVMFSTNAVSTILGVSSDDLTGKSFYECIQENCLPEAIRCLESAKANDSIAYLRFWYRDPRRPEDLQDRRSDGGQDHSSDSEDGGVELNNHSAQPSLSRDVSMNNSESPPSASHGSSGVNVTSSHSNSRTSSGNTTDMEHDSADAIFDRSQATRSSTSSVVASPNLQRNGRSLSRGEAANQAQPAAIEIEAVVSCTSDGLVVILRRARPLVPTAIPQANGFFAAPWGANPVHPHAYAEPQYGFQHGIEAGGHQNVAAGGPDMGDFMQSIREVAVFAWSLTGINGNIASYSRGNPTGEATPPDGFPVWDPRSQTQFDAPYNQAQPKWEEWERTNLPHDGNGTGYTYQHPRQEYLLHQNTDHGHYAGSMNSSEMSRASAFSGGLDPAQLNAQHNWGLQQGQAPGQYDQWSGNGSDNSSGQQNQFEWNGNGQHNYQQNQWPHQNNNGGSNNYGNNNHHHQNQNQ